ncbi:MFS transporter [Leucobacter sp. OH1287]|uniref:MFS transporter n=1 Tax=Leucobacter sp. OH1287 TaxID=2491049 RepID=UPI000F5F5380|nr:MFS transporter [Leucobacter sp. OH1287]RRD61518.1 MFS transporter [Leucobacter sp. OH1287]
MSTASTTPAAAKQLRKNIRAFSLWDFGTSAYSAVILTFVFATYLTQGVAPADLTDEAAIQAAKDDASALIGTVHACVAIVIALLAPMLGTVADTGGQRNRMLRITTLASVILTAPLALIAPDPSMLVLGAILLAVSAGVLELSQVFINSVLPQISTPQNRGRISGTAWALGYWGGIICLGLVLVGFVMPGTGLFGIPGTDALNLRAVPLFVALWMLIFTFPIMRNLPPSPVSDDHQKWNPFTSYRDLFLRIVRAHRNEPKMLHFLIASAIYRDGINAVFTLAGVIAATSYGFAASEIILFGIAANLIAGFGVYFAGKSDDIFGPRAVIIFALTSIIICGTVLVFVPGKLTFWIAGLCLCIFVGPVNSSSRNLLTGLSRPANYAENFGLFAATGRAIGFLGTSAFAIGTVIGGTSIGILGIVLVLLVGLISFIPLKLPARQAEHEVAG